jgi:predicted CDP-diglyceride synthetase/phosphatidate cytidylyltransferase
MKLGLLGGIGGLILAALIIGAFTHFTVTDSPWRVLGFILGLVGFIGCVAVAVRGEKSLNDKAK